MCLRFRNGAIDAIKSAAALRLSPCLCVLRCGGMVCTSATTRLQSLQYAGYSLSANFLSAIRAVGKSPAEAVLAAMKLSQKGGAWLSGGAVQSGHRRYPKGTSYGRTPPDEPKSRKLHLGELVGPAYVSPPNPRIKSQNPKGGFGALWRVFLRYLSSRKERYRRRRHQRLDAVSGLLKT